MFYIFPPYLHESYVGLKIKEFIGEFRFLSLAYFQNRNHKYFHQKRCSGGGMRDEALIPDTFIGWENWDSSQDICFIHEGDQLRISNAELVSDNLGIAWRKKVKASRSCVIINAHENRFLHRWFVIIFYETEKRARLVFSLSIFLACLDFFATFSNLFALRLKRNEEYLLLFS